MRVLNFFRNNPSILYGFGILTVIVLIHLLIAAHANWSPTIVDIDTFDYVWGPLLSIAGWAFVPIATVVGIYLLRNYMSTPRIILSDDDQEDLAALAILIWVIIMIVAMFCHLFSNPLFLIIVGICKWIGKGVLILTGLCIIGFFIARLFRGFLGSVGAFIAAFLLVLLFASCIPSCSRIARGCNNFERQLIDNAHKKEVVVIVDQDPTPAPITTGSGSVVANPRYDPSIVNQGNNNMTDATNQGDVIIINGKQETQIPTYDGGTNTTVTTADNEKYQQESTLQDNDE